MRPVLIQLFPKQLIMLLNITAKRLGRAAIVRNRSGSIFASLNSRRTSARPQSFPAQTLTTQHPACTGRRMATTAEAAAVQVADTAAIDVKDNPLLAVSLQLMCGGSGAEAERGCGSCYPRSLNYERTALMLYCIHRLISWILPCYTCYLLPGTPPTSVCFEAPSSKQLLGLLRCG